MKLGPWLWSPRLDLGVFAGSAAFALALVGLRHALGLDAALPDWAFLAFILAIDVAHVYSTLFRTYLDRSELRARPLLYTLVPLYGNAGLWIALATFLGMRGLLLHLAYPALLGSVGDEAQKAA